MIWNVRRGRPVACISEHSGTVTDMAFHPTQGFFASAGEDCAVHIFATHTTAE